MVPTGARALVRHERSRPDDDVAIERPGRTRGTVEIDMRTGEGLSYGVTVRAYGGDRKVRPRPYGEARKPRTNNGPGKCRGRWTVPVNGQCRPTVYAGIGRGSAF